MFDTVARILLSPVLIYQALSVRRLAQSLPEASGPRYGTQGQGKPLRLAIIGDSSAAGVGVQTQSEALSGQLAQALSPEFELTWHLDALTGATTKSTFDRLATAQAKTLDVVVIALGTNDITRLIPARRWLAQHRALIHRVESLYRPKAIYLSGFPPIDRFPLLPQPLRWTLGRHGQHLERHLKAELRGKPQITYVPFNVPADPKLMAQDGFHPSAELYRIWAKEMASRITSDWPYDRR